MADMQPTHDPIAPEDSEFDLRARAELALAYEPGQPPAHLFRRGPLLQRRGVQRVIALMLLLGSGAGGVLAMRPPQLVRGAIEHEHRERMLRGSFMDPAELLRHLGLDPGKAVPGAAQLLRPCDIDGRLVYHLTTFFDKGGMVTVFAFDQPAALSEGSGWWGNAYWQVVTSRDGKPLVLVAESRAVLARAQAQFGRPA
jgi:hypothetical protein